MKAEKTFELIDWFIRHSQLGVGYENEDIQTVLSELVQLEEKATAYDSKEVQDAIELVKALDWANEVHLTDLNYKAILGGYRSSGGSKFPVKFKKDGE